MPTDLPPIEGTVSISELRQETVGTMPITELVPPAPKPYVTLHDQWKIKIDQWGTVSDVAAGLSEMPTQIKTDLKAYYTARNEVIKASSVAGAEIDIKYWNQRIAQCNSRAKFTALQAEMPDNVRSHEKIVYILGGHEKGCTQAYPDNW